MDWRPNDTDRLLLQAILVPGEPGQVAWQTWSARIRLDDVQTGAFHLLPELYPWPPARGAPAFDRARLNGIVRKTWLENQLRQSALNHFIQAVHAAGIEPLLLRGAIPVGQADRQRDTSDVACAVRLEEAPAALEALARAGWRAMGAGSKVNQPWRYLRSLAYRSPIDTPPMELCWRVLPGRAGNATEDDLWRHSALTPDGNNAARVPSATDQLLLACLDGTAWRAEPDWRWVVDAAWLVRAGFVDWDELLKTCGPDGNALPVRAALEYLAAVLSVPVPPAVLERLQAVSVSVREARGFRWRSQRAGLAVGALRHWQEYRFVTSDKPEPPWGFVNYLQAAWGLSSRWSVPGVAMRRWLTRGRISL